MYISNRSVTQPYWETQYRYLTRREEGGWTRPVGRTGITYVQGTGAGHRITYAKFEKTPKGRRPVAWLWLNQRPGWFCWEVIQLWVFPEYRGQGLARQLFQAAINSERLMVASGCSHTNQSKAMWESFIRKKLFNIWAHDFKDLRRYSQVLWEDDQVVSLLDIYTPLTESGRVRSDVRLVALKKGLL